MESNLFWFNDEQWAKIVPHLPVNQPGPERKDDHWVLSGIMHVLKIGCRWEDCPKDYGSHKTIYNRFSRWSERGIWQKIFEAVAAPSEPPEQAALDSSHVKVHRFANGGKGGRIFRRSGLRKVARTARFTRLLMRRAALGHLCLIPALASASGLHPSLEIIFKATVSDQITPIFCNNSAIRLIYSKGRQVRSITSDGKDDLIFETPQNLSGVTLTCAAKGDLITALDKNEQFLYVYTGTLSIYGLSINY